MKYDEFARSVMTPITIKRVMLAGAGWIALSIPVLAGATPTQPRGSSETRVHRETVDQRITTMHAALRMTPSQEVDWAAVASVMRRNDAAMQKLAAIHRAMTPRRVSAVDDLETYQTFNQAHLDGLKDLISAFKVLYSEMPDAEKANADVVMARFGHPRTSGHGRSHVSGVT